MKGLDYWELLGQAGVSIVFIGLLSVVALAVALERFARLRSARLAPPGLLSPMLDAARRGDLQAAGDALDGKVGLLADLARNALQPGDRVLRSQRAGEQASLALRREQHRAYPLAVVATIAPLIGLFGTVVGMIDAFHVIATAGGLGDPTLLAGGISKALVNTAAGLAVALPALALHHFFKHRLTTVALDIEAQMNQLLDALHEGRDAR